MNIEKKIFSAANGLGESQSRRFAKFIFKDFVCRMDKNLNNFNYDLFLYREDYQGNILEDSLVKKFAESFPRIYTIIKMDVKGQKRTLNGWDFRDRSNNNNKGQANTIGGVRSFQVMRMAKFYFGSFFFKVEKITTPVPKFRIYVFKKLGNKELDLQLLREWVQYWGSHYEFIEMTADFEIVK